MYEVMYSKRAVRTLRKMPRNAADLIRQKIRQLADDPANTPKVRKLVNRAGYRLRIGDWCVIYDVDEQHRIIEVLTIGSRGDVYQ
jgi:mRNA interferase RelE/StbE